MLSLELVVILARLLTVQQVHVQPMVTSASNTTSRPTRAPKPTDAALSAVGHLQLLISCVVLIASVVVVWIEVVTIILLFFVSSVCISFISDGVQDTVILLMLECIFVSPLLLVQVTMSSPSIMQVKFLILCIRLIFCESVQSSDPAMNWDQHIMQILNMK